MSLSNNYLGKGAVLLFVMGGVLAIDQHLRLSHAALA